MLNTCFELPLAAPSETFLVGSVDAPGAALVEAARGALQAGIEVHHLSHTSQYLADAPDAPEATDAPEAVDAR